MLSSHKVLATCLTTPTPAPWIVRKYMQIHFQYCDIIDCTQPSHPHHILSSLTPTPHTHTTLSAHTTLSSHTHHTLSAHTLPTPHTHTTPSQHTHYPLLTHTPHPLSTHTTQCSAPKNQLTLPCSPNTCDHMGQRHVSEVPCPSNSSSLHRCSAEQMAQPSVEQHGN